MKILYVKRHHAKPPRRVLRFRNWLTGLVLGQDGFFETSLHTAGRVTRVSLAELQTMPMRRRAAFDAIVVNAKSGLPLSSQSGRLATLDEHLKGFHAAALFVGTARAETMPPDCVLERFNVVFKREPYADPARYAISARNGDKIVPTHLSNPLQLFSTRLAGWNRLSSPDRFGWQTDPRHDVFFLGAVQACEFIQRQEAWQKVVDADLDRIGGLVIKPDEPVAPALAGQKVKRPDYLRMMLQSRVNLGLEGIGTFTFRHLETLFAGSFLLSNPTVRDQRLRAPLVDGEDYVCFDDLDDMIDKIRHYAAHDSERNRIAKNGRAAYERLHDVKAHAREIRVALDGASPGGKTQRVLPTA